MTVLAGGGQVVVAPAAATEAASPGSAPLRLAAVNAPAQGGPSHCNILDTPGQIDLWSNLCYEYIGNRCLFLFALADYKWKAGRPFRIF